MNVVGAIFVDLDRSPIGTRSRLADELAGRTILRRTVERAARCRQLASLHLIAPQAQAARVAALVDELPVRIETQEAGPAVHQTLVRAGRVWGLESWRGGAGGFCVFDEDFHAPLLQALVHKAGADAVATIPAAAPLFDAAMLDEMICHARGTDEPTGVTFVQAPPGLGGFIIRRAILDQLATSTIPPGAILNYQPTNPMADLTGRETCYRPSVDIIQARGRLLCDTHRSMRRVARLIEHGAESWTSVEIVRRMASSCAEGVDDMPQEIEIELTTRTPTGWKSLLRPIGEAGISRGPISLDTIRRITDAIHDVDDVRIVLAGFGEPCLHPNFADICRMFREAGAAAIAVRTTGLIEDDAVERALFEMPVDLVEVMLDAACGETYARVFGIDSFAKAMQIFEQRLERRVRENRVLPLWVPSLVKANETFDDLEPFVDAWQRRLGMYLVTGYSHCGGQRADRTISSLAPAQRTACRRVRTRMLVLADGTIAGCDQDYRGVQPIGRVDDAPLRETWQHAPLYDELRKKTIADAPLCTKCEEWHRP